MYAPQLTEVCSLSDLPRRPDLVLPKLDGCFGRWDNTNSTFVSKRDNLFHNPRTHVIELPSYMEDYTLVGELLKGTFQETCRTIRKQDRSNSWSGVTFHVFDIRPSRGNSDTFQQRRILLDVLFRDAAFAHRHPWVVKVKSIPYDEDVALGLFQQCVERGLEGLVLRNLDSTWGDREHGWKWKVISDMEGTITGHLPGEGRLRGLLGSYLLATERGHTISVGSGLTDEHRSRPLPIGTKVTFHYRGTSEIGTPLKPTFKGEFIL